MRGEREGQREREWIQLQQATCSAAGAISPRGNGGRCECKSYTTGTSNELLSIQYHTFPYNCLFCRDIKFSRQLRVDNMRNTKK